MKELFKNNIWTNNTKISLLINILLFLMSMNLAYVGQLFLPIICFLIFVGNSFKFEIKNKKIFILLCVFSISFFLFSYKLGLYGAVAFCLPMAYYVGSSVNTNDKDNIKKVIYIIAFGMATHLILNMIMELSFWYDNLSYMFNKPTHYDVWLYTRAILSGNKEPWTVGKVKTTGTSLNYVLICSISYFLFAYEKNKKIKTVGLIMFILSSIYSLALGRRTMLIIFLITTLIYFIYKFKQGKINKKIVTITIAVIVIFILLYSFDVFGLKNIINNIMIIRKLRSQGLSTNRIEIFINNLKLYPKYLWGGRNISQITGELTHNIWGDIYDYSGIIPYVIFIIISIYTSIKLYLTIKNETTTLKILYASVIICSLAVFFVEPIMTGASIFLINIFVVIFSIMDKN